MAYQTGTANNHRDFLAKLKDFATANGWKLERYNTNLASGEHELFLSSKGPYNDSFVLCGYQTFTNPSNNPEAFNIGVMCGPVYSQGGDITSQVKGSSVSYTYLNNKPFTYYFIVDASRIITIAFVSTTCHYTYQGFFEAQTSRGHWPLSIINCGVGNSQNAAWNTTGDNQSGWQYLRGDKPVKFYNRDGNWVTPSFVHPQMSNSIAWSNSNVAQYGAALTPMYYGSESTLMVGELKGCYFINGIGILSMDQVTVDGRKFIVLQNVYRNGSKDYMAVELA